jgi:hypothetical protein
MSKLTIQQRKQLQEICKETLIKKLSQKEAHTYVNTKLNGSFEISFDYVQQVRSQLSKNAKEQLLHLEKDRYALIQSLFFDRKDQLEQMQKVLWSIIDNNNNSNKEEEKNLADNQIKAIEQLHIVSDKLVHLYHTLPFEIEFGARKHFHIHNDGGIFTPEQQERIDKFNEANWLVQYKKDFAEMKKKYPELSDEQINEKLEEEEEEGRKKEDSSAAKEEEESTALLT